MDFRSSNLFSMSTIVNVNRVCFWCNGGSQSVFDMLCFRSEEENGSSPEFVCEFWLGSLTKLEGTRCDKTLSFRVV